MRTPPATRREGQRTQPSHDAPGAGAGVRLGHWHRRALYASLALVAASGALWLLFHSFVRVATQWGEGPHPLESWWLRLHGLAAMLTLLALGSLLTTHAARAWRAGRNRASGSALGAALVLLTGTGYALYYFGGEQSRPVLSLVHWVFGGVAVVLIVAHVALGRGLTVPRRRGRPNARPARRFVARSLDACRLQAQARPLGTETAPTPAGAAPGGGDH